MILTDISTAIKKLWQKISFNKQYQNYLMNTGIISLIQKNIVRNVEKALVAAS